MTADTVGGVWTYALELASALAPLGVRTVLATMGAAPTEAQRAAAGAIPGLELHATTFRLEWMEEPWDDVAQAGDWLLELAGNVRPDLVHLNAYAHAALPFAAPRLVVAHSCVLSWWDAVRREPLPARFGRYAREVRRGLEAADLVVAPTHAMLAALGRHYGFRGPGRVVSNGRDPAPRRHEKAPLVACAARLWDEAKNVAALDAAAVGLAWPVFVAGATEPPGHGAAARLGHVAQLGQLPRAEVARLLERASIYALPARYEPFGLSALEAAQAACALVLGDIPSLREVWGDAAVFVPPERPDLLHAVLAGLIDDPGRRRRLALQALHRGAALSAARMARTYRELYRQLVGRRAAGSEVSCA